MDIAFKSFYIIIDMINYSLNFNQKLELKIKLNSKS